MAAPVDPKQTLPPAPSNPPAAGDPLEIHPSTETATPTEPVADPPWRDPTTPANPAAGDDEQDVAL